MAEIKEDLYFDTGLNSIVASTSCAAAYFGVTAATLSNWKGAGCPRVQHGFWDIKAVTDWRARKDGEKLTEAVHQDPSKLSPGQLKTHYEAQLKQAQLEAAQLRNRIAGGDYLLKSQAVEELSHFLMVLKSSVIGLGRELGQMAGQYMDVEQARKLDRLIDERMEDALEQLAVTGIYEARKGERGDH